MKRLLSGVIFVAITCAAAAQAQTEFEAASVKPYDPGSGVRFAMRGGPGTSDPGRFSCENCSLRSLILAAYDIKDYQLTGAVWSERYDIAAKVPEGTDKAQFRSMLQALLADRFRLTLHRQSEEMTVYNLVVGKGGSKLTPSGPEGRTGQDGFPVPPPGFVTTSVLFNGEHRMGATSAPVAKLVTMLSILLARPVYDATGLAGEYDFTLAWSPDVGGGPLRLQDGSVAASTPDAESGTTIFEAVQQQLGLRLESRKGQVDVLVIDHVEKVPAAN